MKSSKFMGKMEKIKARWTRVTKKCFKSQRSEVIKGFEYSKWCSRFRKICETCNLRVFFSFFFLLPVGSGPKRSMPIEKLSSSSLVSSIFQREGKLHCSLTGRKLWSQVNKMLTSSYLRTGVRKLRICSQRLNRTYIGQARALCYNNPFHSKVWKLSF